MINIPVLVDSSILVAFRNEKDENHEEAIRVMRDITDGKYGKPIITDYIFDETVTVCFARTKSMEITKDFGNHLLHSQMALVKINETLFKDAWEIFCTPLKLSFTDASSVAVIKAAGISHIATFDSALEKIAHAKPVEKISSPMKFYKPGATVIE